MDRVSAPHTFSFADMQVIGKNQPGKSDNLRDAVVQFESLFVNMMLKSMRDANAVLAEGSYLNSSEIQMHQQMLDQQMSVHLSEQGGIGLAEPLMRQLGGGLDNPTGAEQKSAPTTLDSPVKEAPAKDFSTRGALVNEVPPKLELAHTAQLNQPEVLVQKVDELTAANPESFASPIEFVDKLLPTFTAALADSPINPLTALAQAALETGWGAHQMQQANGKPAFNLFGIKASNWTGPVAQSPTVEFLQGQPIQQLDSFRAYDDWNQSVQDYAKLVGGNTRYAGAVEQAQDPAAYLQGLKDAGYATDPNYANKILDVLDRIKQMLAR
jgi:flagellar protein FlgJ